MWQNDIFYFLPCFVSVQFKNDPKVFVNPVKISNFFFHKILVIILLNYGTLQVF